MTALFGNLTNEGLEEAKDTLGGFRILDSDAYTGTIKAAYAGKSSSSNAQSVTIILDTKDAGEYRETFWISNKNNENSYPDKNDKTKRHPLPGYTIIDDICLVTTNKPLSEQAGEEKVMNVYDADAGKEIPKSVPMLIELLGKEVTFGIVKLTKNKQKKDSNGDYQDTDETRDENSTDKIFHFPSNLTVLEAKKKIQTPTFYGAWVEKNRGQTQDRTSKTGATGKTGRPGMPPKAGDNGAKTTSLFGS